MGLGWVWNGPQQGAGTGTAATLSSRNPYLHCNVHLCFRILYFKVGVLVRDNLHTALGVTGSTAVGEGTWRAKEATLPGDGEFQLEGGDRVTDGEIQAS